jgi:hypothetical protein
MNDKENTTFDMENINDVTQTSGVIPASTVIAPQPTLVVPEINMRESAPLANQALQSAQAQVQEQTNLQNLTDQRIVDQQKQFAEQESLAQTIGGGGDVLRNEFNRGQEVLRPIEKDIQDLNSLINQKTRSIQNQLLDEEGRVVPKAFVTGRQAIIQQRGAADLASLGALLDAKNGMLGNAQEKLNQSLQISQAVQKAEIGEKQARITLLKDITGVSQDEEQKEVDRLQAEADKFEKERDAISSIALRAMQSGAGADEIQRITQSKSEDEAIGNATSLGRAAKLESQLKKAQISKIYSEQRAIKEAAANARKDAVSGILSKDQLKTATELRKEVNNLAEVKATKDLEANIVGLLTSLSKENGVGDISSINSFQRLAVDPGVAVREGDVALIQSAQSYGDRRWLNARGLIVGDKLTPEARQQMEDLALDIYQARVEFTEENIQPIRTIASELNIDYDKYIGKSFATREDVELRFASPEVKEANFVNDVDVIMKKSIESDPNADPLSNSLFNNLFK